MNLVKMLNKMSVCVCIYIYIYQFCLYLNISKQFKNWSIKEKTHNSNKNNIIKK